jgi:transcriptional regulator with XRE-family HTH domain
MGSVSDPVVEGFRANLVRIRRRAGLSQEQVSVLASLHRTEVGMLERGARTPKIDTLVKLAGALEVAPADLLDGIEWRPGPPTWGSFGTDGLSEHGGS